MQQKAVEWVNNHFEKQMVKEDIYASKNGIIESHIIFAKSQQKGYSEEEVEDLIYNVCGTVARLQGITLNGNHIDTAYKQFKKK
jgi:hypothetical protein